LPGAWNIRCGIYLCYLKKYLTFLQEGTMALYPVNLNIKDSTCVVIGGGEVARRKIGELIACKARVIVISPTVGPAISNMVTLGKIQWHARSFQRGDLEDAFLVFAATDNHDVQRKVAEEARERKILFNSVDDPEGCSFQVPARVRRGDFLLTVSTGGGSPALAAKLRRKLSLEYGKEYQQLVELLGRIRKHIVADGETSETHRVLFEKLLQLNLLERIGKREWSALESELQELLPETINVQDLISSIQPNE
jgi:precorrin-2 dehydrogenase / sirohydrochlorin ferrochelatase